MGWIDYLLLSGGSKGRVAVRGEGTALTLALSPQRGERGIASQCIIVSYNNTNGAEEYLLHFTSENFWYYLPVYADAILDLMGEGEAPYMLEYLLDALAERTPQGSGFRASGSSPRLRWLGEFLRFLSDHYDLEEDEDDNAEIRGKASRVADRLRQ